MTDDDKSAMPDLNGLTALWQGDEQSSGSLDAVISKISKRAKWRLRRMQLYFTLEIIALVGSALLVFKLLSFDNLPFMLLFILAQGMLAVSLWYAIKNRFGVWRPADGSTIAMLRLEQKRAKRYMAYVYFNVWMFLPGLAMCLLGVWGMAELKGGFAHEKVLMLIQIYASLFAVMLAAAAVIVYRLKYKRADIQQLDRLISELEQD